MTSWGRLSVFGVKTNLVVQSSCLWLLLFILHLSILYDGAMLLLFGFSLKKIILYNFMYSSVTAI